MIENNYLNKQILIILGPGNNGNDGRIVAKNLSEKFNVSVLFYKDSKY